MGASTSWTWPASFRPTLSSRKGTTTTAGLPSSSFSDPSSCVAPRSRSAPTPSPLSTIRASLPMVPLPPPAHARGSAPLLPLPPPKVPSLPLWPPSACHIACMHPLSLMCFGHAHPRCYGRTHDSESVQRRGVSDEQAPRLRHHSGICSQGTSPHPPTHPRACPWTALHFHSSVGLLTPLPPPGRIRCNRNCWPCWKTATTKCSSAGRAPSARRSRSAIKSYGTPSLLPSLPAAAAAAPWGGGNIFPA